MTICPACGADATRARFCPNCGTEQIAPASHRRPLIAAGIVLVSVAAAAVVVTLVRNESPVTDSAGSSAAGVPAQPETDGSSDGSTAATGSSAGKTAVLLGGETSAGSGRNPGSPSAAPTATQNVQPQTVSASSTAPDSVDDKGATISYTAQNAVDGNAATAWRADEGDGVGQELVLTLPASTPLTSVGLVPGYDKVDPTTGIDRFPQNRRVARVSWTFDDGTRVEQAFQDSRTLQKISVNTRTTSVRIRILESRPPATPTDPRNFLPISEIALAGSS